MRSKQKRGRSVGRGGFTVLELLVVISVVILLAAMILPNVGGTRRIARRTECLNNIRNLGIAAQSYATMQKGRLPCLIDVDQPINWGTTDSPLNAASPWTVQLMPYIELGPLAERLLSSSNSPETLSDFRIDNLAAVKAKTFNCPQDPNDNLAGNLSYAINTGYVGDAFFGKDVVYSYDPVAFRGLKPARHHSTISYDYKFNVDQTEPDSEIARSTGVAWPDAQVRIDEVSRADGSTSTLLLVENLQAQRWAGRTPVIDLTGAPTIEYEISDFSFGLPVHATGAGPYTVSDRVSRPVDGVGDSPGGNGDSKSLAIGDNFTGALAGSLRDGRINKNINSAKEGETPRPSSLHTGGVNAIFVGGNGKFLAESIDPMLYAQLLTWDGARKGQSIISDTSF